MSAALRTASGRPEHGVPGLRSSKARPWGTGYQITRWSLKRLRLQCRHLVITNNGEQCSPERELEGRDSAIVELRNKIGTVNWGD